MCLDLGRFALVLVMFAALCTCFGVLCRGLFCVVHGALHVLAKRKPHENNRNEKEPTPGSAKFSANRIRGDFVKRCECLEDDRFHRVPIFAPFSAFWEYAELRTNSIARIAVVC